MTVRKITAALKEAKIISIAYNGIAKRLDIDDPITMEAFGDYLVCGIRGGDGGKYELELVMRPVKVAE